MSLRLTSSVLALMASAMPALADVTPEEVWQAWVDYYQASGYTVTEGSRDLAGETLTLKDVKFDMTVENATTNVVVPQVTLQATGDGKVRTVYADEITFATDSEIPAEEGEEAEKFGAKATISMPGNETVTSGSKEDMTHVMTLPTMKITLDEVTSGEETPPMTGSFTLTNSTATVHSVAGEGGKYDTGMTSEKGEFALNVGDDDEGKMNLTGTIADIAMEGAAVGLANMAEAQTNLAAALNGGLAVSGSLKAGKSDMAFDFAQPANQAEGIEEQSSKGTGTFEGFDLAFSMSKDGLGYQVNSDKSAMEVTSSDIPFPIAYAMEGSSFDVQFPVSKSDEPAPFKMAYSVNGLTIGDALWDLFDAGKQLPRDPASIDLDVTGTLKVLKDLLDPTVIDSEGGEFSETGEYVPEPAPVEPVEVTINQFAVSAVGAKITASGTLAPSAEGSMDAPVGKIDARYEGVNALLDKLGNAGLVPQDQIGGIRMMLTMFARPADGDDVLTTEVEFKEGGSVFANGQQLR